MIRAAATILERSHGDGFTVQEVADEAGRSQTDVGRTPDGPRHARASTLTLPVAPLRSTTVRP